MGFLQVAVYYISSIHKKISVQWYNIYTQVTLRQHVSTVDGHLQASREHFLRYNKVSTQWDPISFKAKVKITYDGILIYD